MTISSCKIEENTLLMRSVLKINSRKWSYRLLNTFIIILFNNLYISDSSEIKSCGVVNVSLKMGEDLEQWLIR